MDDLRRVEQDIFTRAIDGYELLHPAERTVYLVASYVAAVNNGGHASFFYNSYGEFAHETVEALLETDLASQAKRLQRCISQFPRAFVPSGIDERNVAFNALPESANDVMEIIDRQFFLESRDERDKRLLAFGIVRNQSDNGAILMRLAATDQCKRNILLWRPKTPAGEPSSAHCCSSVAALFCWL